MRKKFEGLGRCRRPELIGHKPRIIRKKEDLPQPLGPVIRTCIAGVILNRNTDGLDLNSEIFYTFNERFSIIISPFGVITGTFSAIISSVDSIIWPLIEQSC